VETEESERSVTPPPVPAENPVEATHVKCVELSPSPDYHSPYVRPAEQSSLAGQSRSGLKPQEP